MTAGRAARLGGVLGLLGVVATAVWGAGHQSEAQTPAAPTQAAAAEPAVERVEVPPPPFTDGVFPCSSCHAGMPVNRNRRELTEFHSDVVLKHDEEHRWCLDCHDAENRDQLHLASGVPVSFDESYLLCGQCHGEKLRDWRAGVHGRRSGRWNGHKTYLLCAHCHSPHEPRFKAVQPMPAPARPAGPDEGASRGRR